MASKNKYFGPIIETFAILSGLAAPLFLIYQLQQIAKPADRITKNLRQVNYYLVIRRNGKTYKYKFTPIDILNLIRSVYKEGKQEDAVAWSLISRFALLYPTTYTNFTSFLQAYVQPINPRWFPGGDLFLEYFYQPTTNKDLAIKQAEAREENSKLTLNDIPLEEQELVVKLLNGQLPNPVKTSVHYITSQANADDNEDEARLKQKEFADNRVDLSTPIYYQSSKKGNNWFFNTPTSRSPDFTFSIRKQYIV